MGSGDTCPGRFEKIVKRKNTVQATRRASHAPGTYQQHPRESMRMSAHIQRDEKPLPLPVQRPDQSPPQHARNDLAVTSAQATAQRQSLAFSDASRFPPPDALSAHSAQQIPPMSSTSPPTRRRELPNIPSPQNTPPVSPDRPPQPPAHRRLSKHPPSVKHGIPKVKSDASHAIAESHTEQVRELIFLLTRYFASWCLPTPPFFTSVV